MAVSVDGINVNMGFEALAQGEGIIVTMHTTMTSNGDREVQQFVRAGQEADLFGKRLNAHEADFASAKTRLDTEIDAFATEVTQFIQDWNAGNIEGSPGYTPPAP